MAILTKRDLIDSPYIKLSPNTGDESILPAIEQAIEFDSLEYLPLALCNALFSIHTKIDPLLAEEQAILDYYNLNIKTYYLLQAFCNYINTSEAILTATGFRKFKELQSDPLSKDVYAQILNKYERMRNAARTRALNTLKIDKYTINEVVYQETENSKQPNKQKHFTFIAPMGAYVDDIYRCNNPFERYTWLAPE